MKKQTTKINERIYVYSPDHPFKTKSGYVRRARLVIEKRIGRYLLPGEEVHHDNEIKNDDRDKNLVLMTKAEHTRLHRKGSVMSNESREKISKSTKGKLLSPETKLKIKQATNRLEYKQLKREQASRQWKNPTIRNKMIESRIGRHLSDETKQKISAKRMGFKFTDEVKRKISDSCKGKIPWNKGKNGGYDSYKNYKNKNY